MTLENIEEKLRLEGDKCYVLKTKFKSKPDRV